ncbi:glutamine-hydrolyzing GMP synthase [Solibaculum mannosilyticum]|uniref:GMP synthase (glutamine-hydrolyzing) n=1 Tax=Solibaculum mannosilyticum TaxID=2780922 RepID=A0A7I8D3P6_9FIRM|nr:glutamine-hydrolyzing GMP synthase [Solibaculum mannosilyticum]MCO7135941.1 glutamine-hydrolyzing GMP synthase [[Clostridium] leptum]BCI61436.1 putative GMP synthase [Solibaculum mannosilyticum]CZT55796.1 GMP synthase [glutamine-hydrolyzing] [Eubacteriaceae bacterium CHKCI005]
MQQDMIVILDLGSEQNTLIARDIRSLGVYTEIHPHDITADQLGALPNVRGVILNGGPNRVVDGVSIDASDAVYQSGLPLLAVDHQGKADQNLGSWPQEEEARMDVLKQFVFDQCKAQKNWNMENFIADQIDLIREQVGDKKVLLALSGGVDSSVVAALLIRAIGKQLTCVHVNHGLLRKGEPEQVVEVFQKQMGANLVYVDATDRFLTKLENVADPEKKRKIIGAEFIRVFEEEARKLDGIQFLGQGTIYPDIVESGTKTAKMVKSHHNVGGLPEDMQFELVEPLKMLFKDEVRACGTALGLPDNMVYRQPFPGPGLGVRCLGAITRDRLEALRESDAILREEFDKAGLAGKVWQYFTVVPDFKSVGVRDNARSFEWPAIIRAVNTVDAMTATIEQIDWDVLARITQRITHEVPGINRVLYDLTPKPVGTIEWE